MSELVEKSISSALGRSAIKRAASEFKGAMEKVEESLGPALSEFAEALKETGTMAEKAVIPMLKSLQELDRLEKDMKRGHSLDYKMRLIRDVYIRGLLSPEGVKRMMELAEKHSPRPKRMLSGQETAEKARNLLNMGVISPNDARKMLGLKAINDEAIATAFAISPGAIMEVTDAEGNNGQYAVKDPSMIARISSKIVDPGNVRRAFLGVRNRCESIYG